MFKTLEELIKVAFENFQFVNNLLLRYLGGWLLLITAVAAIATWRKARKNKRGENVLRDLANAIIRLHNKELREER